MRVFVCERERERDTKRGSEFEKESIPFLNTIILSATELILYIYCSGAEGSEKNEGGVLATMHHHQVSLNPDPDILIGSGTCFSKGSYLDGRIRFFCMLDPVNLRPDSQLYFRLSKEIKTQPSTEKPRN